MTMQCWENLTARQKAFAVAFSATMVATFALMAASALRDNRCCTIIQELFKKISDSQAGSVVSFSLITSFTLYQLARGVLYCADGQHDEKNVLE